MSFAEIGIILLVALIVLPPEKLPEAALKLGRLLAQLNSFWVTMRFQATQYLKMLETESVEKPPTKKNDE